MKSKEPLFEAMESGCGGDGGDNIYSLNSILTNVYDTGWYFFTFNFHLYTI